MRKAAHPAPRTDARVAHTERNVFAATVALITEVGPAAVTIERVAERSGVARSTIYRRWTDVNLLFLDAFAELTRLRPVPLVGRLEEDLSTFAAEYARELDDPTFFSVLIFLMEASRDSKQYRTRFRAITRQRQRRGASIVRSAVGRGELSATVDPMAAADSVMAPLFHRRVARHVLLTPDDVAAAVDWALVSVGVRTRIG